MAITTSGNTLVNRSSRRDPTASSVHHDQVNGNLRLPQHQQQLHARHTSSNGGDDDNRSVKSNSGIPPHSSISVSPKYILPFLRCHNTKTSIIIYTMIALFATIQIIVYRSLSSIPLHSNEGYFLPRPKRWDINRERRKLERVNRRNNAQQQTENSAQHIISEDVAKREEPKAVKYTEYESTLLNFLFSLRAAGMKSSILPLQRFGDPLGQNMSIYSNLGCSVFNQLNNNIISNNGNGNSNSTRTAATTTKLHTKHQIQQLWSSHLLSTILQASISGGTHANANDITTPSSDAQKDWTATLLQSIRANSMLDHLPNDE